jgi:hypothetical protein
MAGFLSAHRNPDVTLANRDAPCCEAGRPLLHFFLIYLGVQEKFE